MKYQLNLFGRKSLSNILAPITFVACLGLSASTLAAGGSDGNGSGTASGGGGVTVDISQHPALRDLVDKTVCNWIRASDFQKKYVPESQKTIEQIKAAHWYLGDAYEREVNRLKVCLTEGPLKDVNVTDPDSVTIYPPPGEKIVQKQIAIRLNEMIFVDMSLFKDMNKSMHKEFLFIHEVTHSFLPLDAPRRNDSLRSFIFMLSQGFDAKSLALNIEANHINMPSTTIDLDQQKQNILKLFSADIRYLARVNLAYQLKFLETKLWSADRFNLDLTIAEYENFVESVERAIGMGDTVKLKELYFSRHINLNERFNGGNALEKAAEHYGSQLTCTGCGLGAWSSILFLIRDEHLTPSLQSLQRFSNNWNTNWNGLALFNTVYWKAARERVETYGRYLVDNIPNQQLQVYANDPVVKSCSFLRNTISDKLSKK